MLKVGDKLVALSDKELDELYPTMKNHLAFYKIFVLPDISGKVWTCTELLTNSSGSFMRDIVVSHGDRSDQRCSKLMKKIG